MLKWDRQIFFLWSIIKIPDKFIKILDDNLFSLKSPINICGSHVQTHFFVTNYKLPLFIFEFYFFYFLYSFMTYSISDSLS
jgi:hypothetical protein